MGITFDGSCRSPSAHSAESTAGRPYDVNYNIDGFGRLAKHNARGLAVGPDAKRVRNVFYARFAPNAVPVRTCRFVVNAIVGHGPSPENHTRGNREQWPMISTLLIGGDADGAA